MSGKDSAFRDMKDRVGGFVGGKVAARVERMEAIWAHGAAQGVWKEIAKSVVGDTEVTCC